MLMSKEEAEAKLHHAEHQVMLLGSQLRERENELQELREASRTERNSILH
jgi:hypothetical protein